MLGCSTRGLKTDGCLPWTGGRVGLIFRHPVLGFKMASLSLCIFSRKIMTCLSLKALKVLQQWAALFSAVPSALEWRGLD